MDRLSSEARDGHGFAWLAQYFERLESAFARAIRQAGEVPVAMVLADRTLQFRLAGDTLRPVLLDALAHLQPAAAAMAADLQILCWDGAATTEPLPQPPWQWPESSRVTPVLPADAPFKLWSTPARDALILFDVQRGKAIFWCSDAHKLHTYWYGSPLLMLFHWWSRTAGLTLLHAGCVGHDDRGILLGGRGGSGKSTVALLALLDGFGYVSDDYCLIQDGDLPRAHCLYSTGKLERDHLQRFPALERLTIDPLADEYRKPVLHVARHFCGQVTNQIALRCIVMPHLTESETACWQHLPAAEALRELAPTTLLQLPDARAENFRTLASLVRTLPCYRLELGTRMASVGPALRSLLAGLG